MYNIIEKLGDCLYGGIIRPSGCAMAHRHLFWYVVDFYCGLKPKVPLLWHVHTQLNQNTLIAYIVIIIKQENGPYNHKI